MYLRLLKLLKKIKTLLKGKRKQLCCQSWYLIGYNAKYPEVRTYGLYRFVNMEVDHSVKYIDTGFDARKYYENVVGISVLDREPVEIRIAFSENQAQYVTTWPLHSSQELVEAGKNKYVFRYFLIPTFEFFPRYLAGVIRLKSLSQSRSETDADYA